GAAGSCGCSVTISGGIAVASSDSRSGCPTTSSIAARAASSIPMWRWTNSPAISALGQRGVRLGVHQGPLGLDGHREQPARAVGVGVDDLGRLGGVLVDAGDGAGDGREQLADRLGGLDLAAGLP